MLTHRHLVTALRELGLQEQAVIAHASLKAFGPIRGGAEALLGALLDTVGALVMPTFTYKTMVTPPLGPPNNGLIYNQNPAINRNVIPFHPNLPADPLMGVLAETLRRHPHARRTFHPILSFAGISADEALATQTLFNPLAPIGALSEQGGWVLLLGVNHTVNTSIHYGEKLAGRKQFIRWAMLPERIVECPGFPGCSQGFQGLAEDLEPATRRIEVGEAVVQAIPLENVLRATIRRIQADPLALLCQREDCLRCQAVRATVNSPPPQTQQNQEMPQGPADEANNAGE